MKTREDKLAKMTEENKQTPNAETESYVAVVVFKNGEIKRYKTSQEFYDHLSEIRDVAEKILFNKSQGSTLEGLLDIGETLGFIPAQTTSKSRGVKNDSETRTS